LILQPAEAWALKTESLLGKYSVFSVMADISAIGSQRDKQFLLLNLIAQCSHWNLIRLSQLGIGNESAESFAISIGEVGCIEAGTVGPVMGDGWPVETLFSDGLAC